MPIDRSKPLSPNSNRVSAHLELRGAPGSIDPVLSSLPGRCLHREVWLSLPTYFLWGTSCTPTASFFRVPHCRTESSPSPKRAHWGQVASQSGNLPGGFEPVAEATGTPVLCYNQIKEAIKP